MTGHDDEFIKQIKEDLDQSADALNGGIRSRLTQARNRALEAGKRPAWLDGFGWLPATAFTGVAVMLIAGVLLFNTPSEVQPNMEDLILLSEAEDFEFYEELEFYAWLADEEHSDAG